MLIMTRGNFEPEQILTTTRACHVVENHLLCLKYFDHTTYEFAVVGSCDGILSQRERVVRYFLSGKH